MEEQTVTSEFIARSYLVLDMIEAKKHTNPDDAKVIDWLINNTCRSIALPLQQGEVVVMNGGKAEDDDPAA